MSDLLSNGARLKDRLPAAPGEFELYLERSRNTTVKVYGGEVESLVTGAPSGVGVRYVAERRQGYAYTSQPDGESFDRIVREAMENAEAVDRDEAVALPEPSADYPEVEGLWRAGLAEASMQSRIDVALSAEAAALGVAEIETVEESVYADAEAENAVVSTVGMSVQGRQTFCYCYLSAHARRGDDVQTALGYDTAREPTELDPRQAGLTAGERAVSLLGARPCATGSYTVVLDREVTAAVLGVVVRALSAEAVQKGRSLFAERLGERVGAPELELLDHGIHPEGMDSAAFDDEGVARGRTALIEGGVLRTFLYDTYTARRAGGEGRSTGNAHRGSYRGTPSVSSTNLVLTPGEGSLGDLFGRVRNGFYVVGVQGLHSGANPVSGEFSVGAVGHLIENGSLASPVREVTIASDLLTLLSQLDDRAADPRWIPFHGSAYVPAVAISGVTVSGT